MGRKREERKLFNEAIKNEFLGRYEEGTRVHYSRILSRTNTLEEFYDKDIAQFNFIQINQFLKSQILTTFQAVHIFVSCIANYTEFCKEKGYFGLNMDSFNWARGIGGADGLNEYIYKQAKDSVYITRKELHEIMDFCGNAQDSIIFGLLFESVKGRKGIEELVNLKEDDIEFKDNEDGVEVAELTLTYTTKEEEQATRKLIIEDKVIIRYLQWAIEEEIYQKNNGDNEHMRVPTYKLAKTGYLFKTGGREELKAIDQQNIYNRMNKISKLIGNTYLNPKNIWVSGQIDMGKEIKKEKGGKELTKYDYELINSRFNYDRWHTTKTRIKNYV